MTPTPPNDALDSPIGRYLLDPGGTLKDWVAKLWGVAGPWIRLGLKALIAAAIIGLLATLLLRFRSKAVMTRGARWISILLPPEVDPSGAETLWMNLVELLRPPWRRLLEGQPHLSFEYLWSQEGLRIGIWTHGSVARGLVERAVEAAWPGSKVELEWDPPAPLGEAKTVLGGELRLIDSEHFPLRTDHASDPLRALLGAAGGASPRESAAVQVLARPVTTRRLSRSLKAARDLRAADAAWAPRHRS